MDLQVEIKQDFDGTIAITDFTKDLSFSTPDKNGYLTEDTTSFVSFTRFRYSDTISITVLMYEPSSGEELVETVYTKHDILPSQYEGADSIRIPIYKDGFYVVHQLVLPTLDWLEEHADLEDLNQYNHIYISDGCSILKYNVEEKTAYPVDVKEVLEINCCYTQDYRGTVSRKSFDLFSTSKLKQCYINISKELFKYCPGSTCDELDPLVRFRRDFIWMTLNVINFYLDDNMFIDAQNVLEETMTCNQFCRESDPSNIKNSSCGCYR